jgi:hypothetical protein
MNELTFGTVYNEYYDALTDAYKGTGVGGVRPRTDYNWDASRARACVCDAGWTGLSCSDRMCPVGNDILDTRANLNVAAVDQVQQVALISGGDDGRGNFTKHGNDRATPGATPTTSVLDFDTKTFALKFTSKLNETFTTRPIQYKSGGGGFTTLNSDVAAALEALPNKVINGVTVTSKQTVNGILDGPRGNGIVMEITFTGTSVEGNQNLLEVITNPCSKAGCTPMISGLTNLVSVNDLTNHTMSFVKQKTSADFNSFECGRRGKCDLETGICDCFEGYTSEACTTMSSLV